MKNKILQMYKYNHWANTQILDAVKEMPPNEVKRDLGGSFSTIHDTLLHILWVEFMFIRRLFGLSNKDLSSPPELTTVQEIQKTWNNLEIERDKFLQELQESEINRKLSYLDSRSCPVSIELWQALFQCINHSTFHRGQLVGKLRQLGKVPPATDFILFCQENRE